MSLVYKGLHKEKGNFVAVKKIRLKNMVNKEQLDSLMVHFYNEFVILYIR